MSSIKLSPNASGTGEFTIAAPNSNTNRTLNLPDASGTILTNSGTEAAAFSTLSVAGNNISAVNGINFRNRIINGDMVIDQRNNGASVTGGFAVDRFTSFLTYTSNLTFQQNAGSVTPPPGFANYIGITTGTGRTVGSSDQGIWFQTIEGNNVSDLGWGTANAQTVTLSFWVRSSLTGTHSGSLLNNGDTRSYVFQFPISAANTWEYKTITIPGDTSGTWLTNNGKGIVVSFNVGSGSTLLTTAGSWNAAGRYGATGSVQLCATTGATFYITGVQFEAGSVATPFERLPYGTELMLCQRYFQKTYNTDAAIGVTTSTGAAIARASASSSPFFLELQRFTQVVMRATPTVIPYSTATGTAGRVHVSGSDVLVFSINDQGMYSFGYPYLASTPSAGNDCRCQYTATAEL